MERTTIASRRETMGLYLLVDVLVIAALAIGRVVVGPYVGAPVHPVTLWAALAGLLAGVVAVVVSPRFTGTDPVWVELWRAAVGWGSPRSIRWPGVWIELLFLTVIASVYPWVFGRLLGIPGATWATLPTSVATGVAWGGLTLVLAVIVGLATGALGLSKRDGRRWLATVGGHLAYGLVLGLVVGLWEPLFAG